MREVHIDKFGHLHDDKGELYCGQASANAIDDVVCSDRCAWFGIKVEILQIGLEQSSYKYAVCHGQKIGYMPEKEKP